MKQGMKTLLAVWFLMLLIVNLALIGNVGREYSGRAYDYEKDTVVQKKGIVKIDYIIPFLFIETIMTIFFYLIVKWSFEEEKKNEKVYTCKSNN